MSANRPFEVISPSRKQLGLAYPSAIWPQLEHVDLEAAVDCTGCLDVDEVERRPDLALTANSYADQELAQVRERKQLRFITKALTMCPMETRVAQFH